MQMNVKDFGHDFTWGAATAAYQIEGAWDVDGKSPSIWDTFTQRKGKIKDGSDGRVACDFYYRYTDDLELARQLHLDAFRFSLAWTRILPEGKGKVNQKGLDFYQKVVDTCLEKGIEPWVTLYHWDLPQSLQDKGGWRNRDIVAIFMEYADVCTRALGDRVQNWMVLNEPTVFTTTGYLAGVHAPGEWGWFNFLKAAHHVALSNAEGGRVVKDNLPNANVGTCISMNDVQPLTKNERDILAAGRLDAVINRMFLDPLMGEGYPVDGFKWIGLIERYMQPGDLERLPYQFDFMGLQYYTRLVAAHRWYVPFVKAINIPPQRLGAEWITDMGWEVYPQGIRHLLKRLSGYKNMPPIIITENGAAVPDRVEGNRVKDPMRTRCLMEHMEQVLKAKQEGVDVRGYFIWSLLDNFEWTEGYRPRFGIIRVEYDTQKRIVKDSGWWLRDFLGG